ncbi:MAG: ester cyclase [Streptosporangiaceae bacterium]
MSGDTDANKKRSRLLYEQVFGLGHLDAADNLLAADVLNHGPGVPDSTGSEGIKPQAMLLRTAFPDLEVILNDQIAEGDKVCSFWTGRGTHAGPLLRPAGPLPPSGNPISFEEMRIDRHAGGRIVEAGFLPDRFTLWTQLGLLAG